ncbi:leucine-rich repeat-containing protein [Dorcoceras hygrometricum]|uniref:Leucine-rich repeat-containing protein n=1 Tax=Dorcoceras hygrometricum TaxID=472368 RepID=A0A2Z7AZC6_9LAMI|nr:leucine-rich repeat-containing protein [Dorcoceras hygrometricum]
MSIELQSDFSKGKCDNISSDELTDCARSVDAKISRAGYINQLVGNQLGMEQSWSLGSAQEQERTEQAQLQTKRGADAEFLNEQIKDEEQPA